MIKAMDAALTHQGFDDRVVAVGQFIPRGSTGAMFAGGLAGDEIGGLLGPAGDAIGTAGGALAGSRGVADSRGLPSALLVGVSAQRVYGFAGRSRSREPQQLVFCLARTGLVVAVHQRINVRTLTLATADSSTRIELEGNRLPITHSKDVIDVLTAGR